MKRVRSVAVGSGSVISAGAILFLVVAAIVSWMYAVNRDPDGFVTSPTYELETARYALVSPEVDIVGWPEDVYGAADVRVRVAADDSSSVFVGIGSSSDVDRYLSGVARDRLSRLGMSASDVRYTELDGTAPSGPPGAQPFWTASADGPGHQRILWPVDSGSWALVVMGSDGGPGVEVSFAVAVRVAHLGWIAVGALIGGIGLALVAMLLISWGMKGREPASSPDLSGAAYPMVVEGDLEPVSRWLWIVKVLLVIPHLLVLAFLWAGFAVMTVGAFAGILLTGRYPRRIFEYNVGVLRWSWRVGFYSYAALGTDRYPPFTLADVDYPARLQVQFPERLSRGKALVKWWLLAIPHYVVIGLLTSSVVAWSQDANAQVGLIVVLVIVAGVALAVTGRYLPGVFALVMGLNRWVFRVIAYAALMRDEYPPFRLDQGGSDPAGPVELQLPI